MYYSGDEEDLVGVVRRAEEEMNGLELSQDVEEGGGGKGDIGQAFSRNRGFRKRIRKGKGPS